MGEVAISDQEIANREHISPAKTGDNISGKKVANYGFGSDANWGRMPLPFISSAYDSITFDSYDANNNPGTITFSSLGSTVATLTLTYSGTNITSIVRS